MRGSGKKRSKEDLGELVLPGAEPLASAPDACGMEHLAKQWEMSTGLGDGCHRVCGLQPKQRETRADERTMYGGCGKHGKGCDYRYILNFKVGT